MGRWFREKKSPRLREGAGGEELSGDVIALSIT